MIKKGLLPTGRYHFTIRQATIEHDDDSEVPSVRIVWTIDEENEYTWRNIVYEYPQNKWGRDRLAQDFERIGYTPLPESSENFLSSFIGVRAEIYVGVTASGSFRKNVILEVSPPKQPPHVDVNREKDSSHFFHTKKRRSLPI